MPGSVTRCGNGTRAVRSPAERSRLSGSSPTASQAAFGADETGGVEPQGLRVVLVHVIKRIGLGSEEGLGAGKVREEFGRAQCRRPGEAAVEMAPRDLKSPERNIGKVRIEPRLGVARQEPGAHSRLGRAFRPARSPSDAGGRVGRPCRFPQETAMPGCPLKVQCMRRKPRHQEEPRAVCIRRDLDERSEGSTSVAVERGESAGANGAQEVLSQANPVEIRTDRGGQGGCSWHCSSPIWRAAITISRQVVGIPCDPALKQGSASRGPGLAMRGEWTPLRHRKAAFRQEFASVALTGLTPRASPIRRDS
jgi:hypothetical protein